MADPVIATAPATGVGILGTTGGVGVTSGGTGGQAGTIAEPKPSLLGSAEPAKAAEPAKPAAEPTKDPEKPKPAEIKLALPKDSLMTQAQVDKIAAVARERGLSQEVADALLAAQGAQLQEFADTHLKAWEDRKTAWGKELEGNKEFGGDKLKEWDAGTTEVVMKYGGKDMYQMLTESGYAKHPAVAKFLWNIHKAMRPDKIVAPHAPSVQANSKSVAESLFPSAAKKT